MAALIGSAIFTDGDAWRMSVSLCWVSGSSAKEMSRDSATFLKRSWNDLKSSRCVCGGVVLLFHPVMKMKCSRVSPSGSSISSHVSEGAGAGGEGDRVALDLGGMGGGGGGG